MTRVSGIRAGVVCVVALAAAVPAQAVQQVGDARDSVEVAHMLATIRVAAERYADVNAAIAAGYRLVGEDMPNMGEHWINPRIAMRGELDPALPAALTYLPDGDGRMLTGVAFIAPQMPGRALPPPPIRGASWHFHAETIDEEAAGDAPAERGADDRHDGRNSNGNHGDREREVLDPRMAMLHVWLFVDNPDGLLSPDNWSLPYVRLGLPVPESVRPDAARALSLVSGGVDYYAGIAGRLSRMDAAEQAVVRLHLETCRLEVDMLLADGDATTLTGVGRLAELWRAAWAGIARDLDARHQATVIRVAG